MTDGARVPEPRDTLTGQLRNASLSEVVFELRWETVGQDAGNPIGNADPGYAAAFDSLSLHASKLGMQTVRDFLPVYGGIAGGISRRYFIGPDQPFPILQLGYGIFAANASSDYEWESFRSFALDSAQSVIEAYPSFREHKFRLSLVELRYINSFGAGAGGDRGLTRFLKSSTTIEAELPPALKNSPRIKSENDRGRYSFNVDCRKPADSRYHLDIATVTQDETPAIRMEHKVTLKGDNLLAGRNLTARIKKISDWLDQAHDVTSPSFTGIIKASVLNSFR